MYINNMVCKFKITRKLVVKYWRQVVNHNSHSIYKKVNFTGNIDFLRYYVNSGLQVFTTNLQIFFECACTLCQYTFSV